MPNGRVVWLIVQVHCMPWSRERATSDRYGWCTFCFVDTQRFCVGTGSHGVRHFGPIVPVPTIARVLHVYMSILVCVACCENLRTHLEKVLAGRRSTTAVVGLAAKRRWS